MGKTLDRFEERALARTDTGATVRVRLIPIGADGKQCAPALVMRDDGALVEELTGNEYPPREQRN